MDTNTCYMSLYGQRLSIQGAEHKNWLNVTPTNKSKAYGKGDRFKIAIDFVNRKGTLFYNDVKLQLEWSEVSDRILPCVSLYNESIITITAWNAH